MLKNKQNKTATIKQYKLQHTTHTNKICTHTHTINTTHTYMHTLQTQSVNEIHTEDDKPDAEKTN